MHINLGEEIQNASYIQGSTTIILEETALLYWDVLKRVGVDNE